MKLHSQFLRLHGYYGSEASVQITLDEMAETLECTHRNALNIIRKMEAEGWIEWHSQRGRGKRSELKFRVDPEEIAAISMIKAIDRHEIKKVMDDIKEYTDSAKLPGRLQGWLMRYFGHHTQVNEDKEQIDILRLPLRQQIHTIDPLAMNLLAESFVASHIYDGLLTRNETGEVIPHLAHDYDVSEDRMTWVFYLRKDVYFHHGNTLTADDIVYTFERLRLHQEPLLYNFIVQSIASVTALSSTCVRFTLNTPNEHFLPFLCTSRAVIVPFGLDEAAEHDEIRFSGTGPFKVTEFNSSMCILEAFSAYFISRPHLDIVEIIQIPWSLPEQNTEAQDGADPLFHVLLGSNHVQQNRSQYSSHTTVRKLLTCNTRKQGPLKDPNVRKHVFQCIKYEDPIRSDIISESPQPDAVDGTYLVLITIPQYRPDAMNIKERLERFGYEVRVKVFMPEDFKGPIRMESDLILFSLLMDRDESLRRHDLYLTLSSHVECSVEADIIEGLNRIMLTRESNARLRMLQQIEEQLIEQDHLYVLYDRPFQTSFLPSVRGIRPGSQGWVDLRYLWFPPDTGQSESI
ncbi:ABC transporter substrate-binding protein [Paenibacillus sp. PDC88]|uniref:ABC transporter substrate-binding protein n=1 Tax=Paenibacillus sp. PDC88 TaxID=1884375 RepID=UPI00089B0251|nr:ABC transporter substrate-binding protein [Paenibacillus sp. PDC88]SDW70752.1 DNA-binding transcriptional regulator SgrR of sgrS sRNA, contains a MarR-type HTH domain and a solute-binding domain [Paenibacillus sp. PDC88]